MITRLLRSASLQPALFACLLGVHAAAQPIPLDPSITNTKPYRRWLWWKEDHGVEDERQAAFARKKAFEEIQRLKQVSLAAVVPGNAWQAIGPAPLRNGQTTPASAVSGRIADIAVDPADTNHWLIGGAQAGVWETRNAGVSWKPCSDTAPSLAMGAIAFSPSNPRIVYAGTGEQAFSGDAHDGGGLLKSFDGGKTWQTIEAITFLGTRFGEIRVDPANPEVLGVATSDGLFRSTTGGTSWTRSRSGTATDLEVHPSNFDQQYAALGSTFSDANNGVYRSVDGGETWQTVTGPWQTAGSVGRIELALAPSAPGTVYVSVHNIDDGKSLGVWRTDNAWATTPTWRALVKPLNGTGNLWYNHDLSVDPQNAEIVYLAANRLLKFQNNTWTDVQGSMHVDVHTLAWAGRRLIVGNDGGCWSTQNGGTSYANHNTNLQLTQFYYGAIHPTNPDRALGGSQDNGTGLWTGLSGGWGLEVGGDGAACAFSVNNPNSHWIASFQDLEIQRTLNAGGTWTSATSGIEDANRPFIGPLTMGNRSADVLLTGTHRVYKCTNFFSAAAPVWRTNSADLGAALRAFAFAKSDPTDRTYCVGVSGGGTALITTNGGSSWNSLDKFSTLPNRTTRDFAFNPTNANVLYTVLSGFSGGAPQCVFVCTNALAASPRWRNISPPVDIPASAIALDGDDPRILYVGTDLGIWRSTNEGASWTHQGPETGFPNVEVDDLQLSNASGRLIAFTHGRGAFAYYTANSANLGVLGSVSPTNASPGCGIAQTLVITNGGPLTATGIRLTNSLSPLLKFAAAETSAGNFSLSGGRVIFNLGSLGPGASAQVRIQAIAETQGQAAITSTVRADQPDPATADNALTLLVGLVSDAQPPVLTRAEIAGDGGSCLLSFDGALDELLPGPGAFSLWDGNLRPLAITAVRPLNGGTTLQLVASLLAGVPPYHLHCPAFTDCAGNRQAQGTNLFLNLASVTLIAKGSTWRYLDNGSNQATSWQALSFDDSSWKTGPARLGYGGDGETTVVDYGPDAAQKFVTTYFRHHFELPGVAPFSRLNLLYTRDDGVAIYLNNQPLLRNNLAANAVYNTLASSTVNGVDETTYLQASTNAGALAVGSNVLSAEVHQSSVDSSDLGWDLELVATLVIPPHLVDSDQDGIPDAWERNQGLNPGDASDALRDDDDDGQTNYQEYLAGTDSHNPQDALRLLATFTPESGVQLSFQGVSNRWYTLQRRHEPDTGSWLNWQSVPARNTTELITLVDTNASAAAYYRLVTPAILEP